MLLNKDRLEEQMDRHGLDAVIATSPENVTYSSGFWALPQWIRRGPQAYVVWPANGVAEPEIVTSTSTLDLIADQDVWIPKVRRYGEFHVDAAEAPITDAPSRRHLELRNSRAYSDALAALVSALKDAGLDRDRIGLEEDGLPPGYADTLASRLPHITWAPAGPVFRVVRAVKTSAEIERLAQVAGIAERSIVAALRAAEDGASERDLARAFDGQTVEEGALPVLTCIGFGERSALMNVQPSERKLRRGDIVRFDVGGRYRHYRADVARIASFGEAPAEARRQHRALLRGVQHAREIIRPGMPAAKLFEEVMGVVRAEGLPHYRRDHVGHGIGLDGYDAPSLSAMSTEVIEEGMVLCVETPYYEIGRWGLQVEDMIVVRAHGAERLMATDGGLMEIEP
jgi:Xaa-Pro aminopeptidase